MTSTSRHGPHIYGARDTDDSKYNVDHISNASLENVQIERSRKDQPLQEPPLFIKNLSGEERHQLELALVRKIDLRLLPMLIIMYVMNYLDRNNIAAARLAGLEDELHLTSTQYLTALSILFVGYILMQIPSNLFLNKIGKPAIYLPSVMILWGIISGATGAVQSYGGLVAVRFCLGFVEAAYFPGCLFFLSSWYTRKELGLRTATLYSGSYLSGAFSGLISAGVTNGLDGAKNLRAWRWLFIIEGAITVVIALAAYAILPNFPRTTSWLTDDERQLAIWRLLEDIGEDDWVGSEKQSFLHGMKLAFSDIKLYILMAVCFCIISSGTVVNLFPTIVKTLGYSNIQSLLLTVPPYVLAAITSFLNAWHADRTGERYFHVTIPLYFGVFSYILAATTTTSAPRYFAMMLMVFGFGTGFVVALAWISNIIPRPPAKRAVALAAINAISNSASIYTPFMYPESAGPRFIVAMSVNCATAFIAICAATVLRVVLVRLNRKLDRGDPVEGALAVGEAVPGEASKKGFRFAV